MTSTDNIECNENEKWCWSKTGLLVSASYCIFNPWWSPCIYGLFMWFKLAVISSHPEEYWNTYLNSRYLKIFAEDWHLEMLPSHMHAGPKSAFSLSWAGTALFPVNMELTWKFTPRQMDCHSFFFFCSSEAYSNICRASLMLYVGSYWEFCSWF